MNTLTVFAYTEVAETSAAPYLDLLTSVLLSVLVVVIFLLIILFTAKVMRLPVAGRVLVVLPYLLAVGMFMYQLVPLVSIVALTAGFGLALSLVILALQRSRS